MRRFLSLLLFSIYLLNLQAVEKDSIPQNKTYPETASGTKFSPIQLIAPGVLIAAGVYGTIDKTWDRKVQEQAVKWGGNTFLDNILPVVPPAAVYILNWCGVAGKHNFVDRTVIAGTGFVLATGTCLLLKNTIDTPRPDGDGQDAFPSMHTAVAFVGAEFMRQEFKDKSPWYGVAGYTFAATTGFLRIYNNRHWMSDVLAGAGIGILSAQAAYWLYPEIRKLYAGTKLDHAMIIPFGDGRSLGLSLSATF